MKKLLAFLVLLAPSTALADRLGSLKSNAEVLLSTQASAGTFNLTFWPDQAKLPGTAPCVISNSTTAVVSSLLCDDSTDESVTWSTVLNPFPSGTLKVDFYYTMLSAISGDVVLAAQLMCVTASDSADVDTESFDTAGTGTRTVPGTAGFLDGMTVTPSGDSCAQGDLLVLKVYRDADAGGDTASGDIEIRRVRLYAE